MGRAPQRQCRHGRIYGPPHFLSHPIPQIHQIYETMQRWDPVASTLPDVVQRLVTLRDLHEQGEGLEGLLDSGMV